MAERTDDLAIALFGELFTADQLARNMNLPDGMQVKVHVSPEPDVNAFATFGGNIVVMQGLLEKAARNNGMARGQMLLANHHQHFAIVQLLGPDDFTDQDAGLFEGCNRLHVLSFAGLDLRNVYQCGCDLN